MRVAHNDSIPSVDDYRHAGAHGGSSAGKSTIARAVQAALSTPFLTVGVDTLIDAMPPALSDDSTDAAGIVITDDGRVLPGAEFRRLESGWYHGLAEMARAGVDIILDEVFLGGATSQARIRAAFDGLLICWVAVRCDPMVAVAREATRGDRAVGMAARHAESVHIGVSYDLQLDTSMTSAAECARQIVTVVES